MFWKTWKKFCLQGVNTLWLQYSLTQKQFLKPLTTNLCIYCQQARILFWSPDSVKVHLNEMRSLVVDVQHDIEGGLIWPFSIKEYRFLDWCVLFLQKVTEKQGRLLTHKWSLKTCATWQWCEMHKQRQTTNSKLHLEFCCEINTRL